MHNTSVISFAEEAQIGLSSVNETCQRKETAKRAVLQEEGVKKAVNVDLGIVERLCRKERMVTVGVSQPVTGNMQGQNKDENLM